MKRMSLAVAMMLLVAACGSSSGDDPELLGSELFDSIVVGGKAGCGSCHSVEPGDGGIGPSLAGISSVAAGRVPGLSAADYLRQSITDPDDYLVEGFNSGVMPKGWDLSETQINSLVEYLLDR